jgi:hypothetical protein
MEQQIAKLKFSWELIKDLDLRNSILVSIQLFVNQNNISFEYNKKDLKQEQSQFVEDLMETLLTKNSDHELRERIETTIQDIGDDNLKEVSELISNINDAINIKSNNPKLLENMDRNVKVDDNSLEAKSLTGYTSLIKPSSGNSALFFASKIITKADLEKPIPKDIINSKYFNLHLIKFAEPLEVYLTKVSVLLNNMEDEFKFQKTHRIVNNDKIDRDYLVTKIIPNSLSNKITEKDALKINRKSLIKSFLIESLLDKTDQKIANTVFKINQNNEIVLIPIDFGETNNSYKHRYVHGLYPNFTEVYYDFKKNLQDFNIKAIKEDMIEFYSSYFKWTDGKDKIIENLNNCSEKEIVVALNDILHRYNEVESLLHKAELDPEFDKEKYYDSRVHPLEIIDAVKGVLKIAKDTIHEKKHLVKNLDDDISRSFAGGRTVD